MYIQGKPDYHGLIRTYRNITTLDDKFFRKLHAVYLGSIEFSDFLFGLLLAAVDDASDRPTTWFFCTSRTLMECADPLREGGGRDTPLASSRFGSKLPRLC